MFGMVGGQFESIAMPLLDITFSALFAGVGLADLKPWAGRVAVSWGAAAFASLLVTHLLEGTGDVLSTFIAVVVPCAAAWLLRGSVGGRILSPGRARLFR